LLSAGSNSGEGEKAGGFKDRSDVELRFAKRPLMAQQLHLLQGLELAL
jgi:hypothetical protein